MSSMARTQPVAPYLTIGASDISVALGVAPWADASPMKLWAELSGLTPYRQSKPNTSQKVGSALERTVLGMYADDVRNTHAVCPNTIRYPGPYPWMHASPDAGCIPNEQIEWGPGGVIEQWDPFLQHFSQVVNIEAKVSIRDDVWPMLPVHYQLQALWQNVCTGRQLCIVAVLFLREMEFRIYPVYRDPMVEAKIVRKVWNWYERHVVGAEPPPPDDSKTAARTLAQIRAALRRSGDIVAGPEDMAAVHRVREIKTELKRLESEKQLLENRLRLATVKGKMLRSPAGERLASWTRDGKFLVSKEKVDG